MPASSIKLLEEPDIEVVNCHAISLDEQFLALCANSEEIHIFELVSGKYQRTDAVLAKHSQRVTGLDWSCHRRLLSVSEDRTAFVWEQDSDGTWRSSNVELKAQRAALCAAWSPSGDRFAVGLSSKDTALCYWREEVSCWVAMKVGKAKAAITALAWHNSSRYLATGSTDRHCVVYDVSMTEGPGHPDPGFGTPQVTEVAGAWINDIAFSNGNVLAFTCQDATVRFKSLVGGPDAPVQKIRYRGLPFLRLAFVDRTQLIACGFDYVPVLFLQRDEVWQVAGSLDVGAAPSSGPGAIRESLGESRKGFRPTSTGGKATSQHSNTITSCCPLKDGRFSTASLDGTVVVWQIS